MYPVANQNHFSNSGFEKGIDESFMFRNEPVNVQIHNGNTAGVGRSDNSPPNTGEFLNNDLTALNNVIMEASKAKCTSNTNGNHYADVDDNEFLDRLIAEMNKDNLPLTPESSSASAKQDVDPADMDDDESEDYNSSDQSDYVDRVNFLLDLVRELEAGSFSSKGSEGQLDAMDDVEFLDKLIEKPIMETKTDFIDNAVITAMKVLGVKHLDPDTFTVVEDVNEAEGTDNNVDDADNPSGHVDVNAGGADDSGLSRFVSKMSEGLKHDLRQLQAVRPDHRDEQSNTEIGVKMSAEEAAMQVMKRNDLKHAKGEAAEYALKFSRLFCVRCRRLQELPADRSSINCSRCHRPCLMQCTLCRKYCSGLQGLQDHMWLRCTRDCPRCDSTRDVAYMEGKTPAGKPDSTPLSDEPCTRCGFRFGRWSDDELLQYELYAVKTTGGYLIIRCLTDSIHSSEEDDDDSLGEEAVPIVRRKIGDQFKLNHIIMLYCEECEQKVDFVRFKRKCLDCDSCLKYCCRECDAKFPHLGLIQTHVMKKHLYHEMEKRQTCSGCSRKFLFESMLELHERKCLQEVFKCNHCDFKTRDKELLVVHMKMAHLVPEVCSVGGADSNKAVAQFKK